MSVIALIQARMSSTRLPKKVALPLLDEPILGRIIERVKRSQLTDKIVVVTSLQGEDDYVASIAKANGVSCYRGNLHDVLDRYYQSAKHFQAKHIVRITADCPFIDPNIIDEVIQTHLNGEFDYTSNTVTPSFPDGLDVEVFTFSALEETWQQAKSITDREHVTHFIYNNPKQFSLGEVVCNMDLSRLRWTVDEPEDYQFAKVVFETLYLLNQDFTFQEIHEFLLQNPKLAKLNQHLTRNQGLQRSIELAQSNNMEKA